MNSEVDICGIHKEALIIILNKTINHLNILHYLCPKYSNDNGVLINKMNEKIPNIIESESLAVSDDEDLLPKLKSSKKSKPLFRNLSKTQSFNQQLLKIIDEVEVTKAEWLNKSALRFENGRIQYINEEQIKERKLKEDLQNITEIFMKTVREITEFSSYQSIITYNYHQRQIDSKITNDFSNDKKMSDKILILKQEINNTKNNIATLKSDFNYLVKHLKHQFQETKNKIMIENKYNQKYSQNNIIICKTNFNNNLDELMNTKNHYLTKIKNEQFSHEELIIFLRNNNNDLQQRIEYWSDKYSNDTNNIKLEIKNFQKNHENIRNKFYNLLKLYKEYDEIVLKAQKDKSIKLKQDLADKEFTKNVLIIQSWWRNLCYNLKLGPFAIKKKRKGGKNKKQKSK